MLYHECILLLSLDDLLLLTQSLKHFNFWLRQPFTLFWMWTRQDVQCQHPNWWKNFFWRQKKNKTNNQLLTKITLIVFFNKIKVLSIILFLTSSLLQGCILYFSCTTLRMCFQIHSAGSVFLLLFVKTTKPKLESNLQFTPVRTTLWSPTPTLTQTPVFIRYFQRWIKDI